MKAIGYARVSTEDQAISLEAQQAKIRSYCQLYELELVEMVAEEGSGRTTTKRPKLQEALRRIEAGEAQALVVLKLDRLTRSVSDLCQLMDFLSQDGRRLCSVQEHVDTTTSTGRLMANILGTFAQFERERIAERTTEALRHQKAQGRVYNHTPYGKRRQVVQEATSERPALVLLQDLPEDCEEREAMELAQSMREAGQSLRAIGAVLRSRGIQGKQGGAWGPSSVKRLLAAVSPGV